MGNNYHDFEEYIKLMFTSLKKERGKSKDEWIMILKKYNFGYSYIITKTPEILKTYKVDSSIVMTLSNFAYIMFRHGTEYDESVLLQIKETIDSYDFLFEGIQQGMNDYKFYKLFYNLNTTDPYGIEVAIDKPQNEIDEYIVHVNYIGSKHKRAIKQVRKMKKKFILIDEKT